jgi:hypothetical protein
MIRIFTQHELAVGERMRLGVGLLDLLVCRGGHGWTLSWRHEPAGSPPALRIERDGVPAQLDEGASQRSFAFSSSQGPLELVPRLADRAVIVRPVHELTVAPRALVQLYLTTSLWVGLQVEGGDQPLLELPCVLPKDTWFGSNSREGERCYAGRLPLCFHATDCAGPPHRAITPLIIRNRSSEPLPVARLRVPVPRLPLHRAADGSYWTSRVSVVRKEGSDEVDVEVLPHAPDEAGPARLVTPARDQTTGSVVSRALGTVFSYNLIP